MSSRTAQIFLAVMASAATAFGQAAPAASGNATSGNTTPPPAAQNTPAAEAQPALPAQIRIVGSDMLQTAVAEPLNRYAKQNGLNVIVDLRGTAPALLQLKGGEADMAIISAPSGQKLAPQGYSSTLYCYQVDYLLVARDNPVTEIDRSELTGIFAAGQEQDISRWSQLGVSGEWADRQIYPASTSPEDGVVQEIFKVTMLNRAGFRPGVRVLPTPEQLVKTVTDIQGVIGLCGYNPGPPLRALLVSLQRSKSTTATAPSSPGATTVAFAPTEENVYNGDYPLQLPFYVIYKPADKARLHEVLRVLFSDDFANHLRDQHLMPVPDTFRKRALLELDKPN